MMEPGRDLPGLPGSWLPDAFWPMVGCLSLINYERWDMQPRSPRALILVTALALGTALGVVVPGTAAYAVTTYTWDKTNPEGDHRNWDTKENWSPAGVPGDGDSVIITDGGPDVGVPTDLHLQDLEVTGFGRLSGGSIIVDRLFQWSGGTIHTALTVAQLGTVTAGDGKNRKQLGADLTVKGRLDLLDSGTTDKSHLQVVAPNRIVVAASGTLSSVGNSMISYTACCVNPARIVNNGSLTVLGGTLTLRQVQLDQKRDLWINGGAKLHSDGGTAELAAGSSYTGGGELHLDRLSVLTPKDDATLTQGAAKLFGTIDLGKDFTLRAGNGTQLTGTATVGGRGTLLLDAAQVYGEITTGPDLRTQVIGTEARPTRITVWQDLPGYRGTLTLRGVTSIASGAVVRTSTGALLTVAKGGTLRLLPGALVDAGSCCAQRAEVVNERGGTLEVPSGPGTTATLKFVAFRTAGTVQVATGRALLLDRATFLQSDGLTEVADKGVLSAREPLVFNGGELAGTGTVRGNVTSSGAVVSPGAAKAGAKGTLTIDGTYTQTARGAVKLDVGGTKPGTGHDQLKVTGAATLAGTLEVSSVAGHKPTVGAKLVGIRAKIRVGTFACVRSGGKRGWLPGYTATTVGATATNGIVAGCGTL
ncbi:MAG TPA: hypothetical protein VFN19_04720, partial [Candidatus Nanopelagicales bacterium]|nr:hypothetical protein [Candidatus Nanopelagicales bacterium]